MPAFDFGQKDRLTSAAWEARLNAYSPYSQFRVGAALLCADGRVFTGANVENASFSISMCAERVALGAAVAAGARSFVAIAVAGEDGREGVLPCGACRQALLEFSPRMTVLRCLPDGTFSICTLDTLVPAPFTGQTLSKAEAKLELVSA